jgi:hypothetical protein
MAVLAMHTRVLYILIINEFIYLLPQHITYICIYLNEYLILWTCTGTMELYFELYLEGTVDSTGTVLSTC